jgi:hypothetical protein
MLTLITLSGRNKHGQRLCSATCGCGNVFEAVHNNVKRGRTTTCGHCGKPAKVTATPVVAPVSFPTPPADLATIIAAKEATADACEMRARILEQQTRPQETTDLDAIKAWTAETGMARKLRQEIARLKVVQAKAETGAVKDTRTQAEIMKAKIDAMKHEQ